MKRLICGAAGLAAAAFGGGLILEVFGAKPVKNVLQDDGKQTGTVQMNRTSLKKNKKAASATPVKPVGGPVKR